MQSTSESSLLGKRVSRLGEQQDKDDRVLTAKFKIASYFLVRIAASMARTDILDEPEEGQEIYEIHKAAKEEMDHIQKLHSRLDQYSGSASWWGLKVSWHDMNLYVSVPKHPTWEKVPIPDWIKQVNEVYIKDESRIQCSMPRILDALVKKLVHQLKDTVELDPRFTQLVNKFLAPKKFLDGPNKHKSKEEAKKGIRKDGDGTQKRQRQTEQEKEDQLSLEDIV